MDKKVLPKRWLQIHRHTAEKARGKKLSARERREMKDDLSDKLLPRVLPTVQLIDVLLFRDQRTALLLATSKGAREAFAKLFFESFSVPVELANPLVHGLRAGLSSDEQYALERLDPVEWPRDDARRAARRPARAEPQTTAEEIDA
jgi:hypothetical protein